MDIQIKKIEELDPELRQRMVDESFIESGTEYNLFSHPFIESVVRVTHRTIKINFKNGRQLFVLRHPSAIYEIIPMGVDYEGSLLDIHDRDKNRYLIPYANEEKVRYYIDKIGKMS